MSPPDGQVDPSAGAEQAASPEKALEELRLRQATHPFWEGRLLRACRRGHLSREDLGPVFSQYYLHCRALVRCLHALMANCENDAARARLAQLVAEETVAAPEPHPLERFRRFLSEGLGVEVEGLRGQDATHHFARECLDFCMRATPAAGSAFLGLGTESLLPRLYSVFAEGLLHAGVSEKHLRFFRDAMAADSRRARVLEELMLAHAHEPGWHGCSLRAVERALELRGAFFDSLFDAVPRQRVTPLLERIQAGCTRTPERPEPRSIHLEDLSRGESSQRNAHAWRGIDFTEERAPFQGEVLEARILRIAPGQGSEARREAHETLLAVLSGTGRVRVNATEVRVRPGQLVFVPRWAWQQAHSTGETELTLLSVTDQGLATRAHVGNVLRSAREALTEDTLQDG